MKVYEFRCTACQDTIVTEFYLEGSASEWGHIGVEPEVLEHAECGPLKRVWSAAIAWPMSQRGH